MDNKQRKQNQKGSKFLPKAASLVPFQPHQPPFSPARDPQRRSAEAKQRAFSGPMFEPTTRPDHAEPTSPKVSCIGQIKHKKDHKKKLKENQRNPPTVSLSMKPEKPRKSNSFFKIFKRSTSDITDAVAAEKRTPPPVGKPTPSLGEMMKYSSGRGTLMNFDWRAIDESDSDDEFSDPNPIPTRGAAVEFKPREEVNLWKRRTISPPTPLSLR